MEKQKKKKPLPNNPTFFYPKVKKYLKKTNIPMAIL